MQWRVRADTMHAYTRKQERAMTIRCSRYHDFSAGHRVVGHESKCAYFHGHNYRVHFSAEGNEGSLDGIGRVIDFSQLRLRLCNWLELKWDHKMLLWEQDPQLDAFLALSRESVVSVPFNPTAENMADYLLRVVGPTMLLGTQVRLVSVRIDETRKCSAEVTL